MKTRKEMINILLINYKKTLNPLGKWYKSDIQNYFDNLSKETDKEITRRYQQSTAFNSLEFDRMIEKEEKRMLKAGLYDIRKMKPVNQLD